MSVDVTNTLGAGLEKCEAVRKPVTFLLYNFCRCEARKIIEKAALNILPHSTFICSELWKIA